MPLLTAPKYTAEQVPDHPHGAPEPVKIIHIGAGASGLLFAHKARKFLKNYELICYEKNSVIGGTWYENRYPGCACDVPAHNYTYPFEPNTEWSGFYSYASEIQDYFVRFAKKYDVESYVVFNTEVKQVTWSEEQGKWLVNLQKADGTLFTDSCNVLVNGAGVVNRWKWPDIDGLHDFKGTLSHSADWDPNIDWKGKRVALIGTGSSSIQILPEVQPGAEHVTVFIRNQYYVAPTGITLSNKEADPEAMEPGGPSAHRYTEKEKEKFRDDPEYLLQYRRKIERHMAAGFRLFFRGSEQNLQAKAGMKMYMEHLLGDNEELKRRIIPQWSPGCRRITPGEGYLQALLQKNVSPVYSPIVKVIPEGIVTADGATHNVDILICATGFEVQFLPWFNVVGLGGRVMQDYEPNVYGSISVPHFPNYFIVNGPRGNWGQGCSLPTHEVQVEYIIQMVKKIQEDGIKFVQPREDLTFQLNEYMDAWHRKHSVWAEDCKSWYKDNKRDGRVYIWSGSMQSLMKFLKRPRLEHYDVVYKDPGNVFQFMGNGWTVNEWENMETGNIPVDYIRNDEDAPYNIE
ncbi:uncharacterized protein Z519_03032 [Cladophialophora bantiana CBS 173.52]|uniref:L-ornithine N(5)-oxygenase n=1 Tax=Cladophialophora bantiana (strain ATCC 10958 / CBS 173.52 / CDC B-1940 / NIH 8579) TaxID=1442370 RepID=A0A0D2F1C0_CLAB1|nr:uncharacterized protein Z519_03032 [Cladophialophora bantiana CBS 173.52]KIW95966.1 hypothetical protein Z519_03032 [Cladophialophora bantiana CBS 173.52]